MKPSVAPSSCSTPISSRRDWMSRRTVLPTTSNAPEAEQRRQHQRDAPAEAQPAVQALAPHRVVLDQVGFGQRAAATRPAAASSPLGRDQQQARQRVASSPTQRVDRFAQAAARATPPGPVPACAVRPLAMSPRPRKVSRQRLRMRGIDRRLQEHADLRATAARCRRSAATLPSTSHRPSGNASATAITPTVSSGRPRLARRRGRGWRRSCRDGGRTTRPGRTTATRRVAPFALRSRIGQVLRARCRRPACRGRAPARACFMRLTRPRSWLATSTLVPRSGSDANSAMISADRVGSRLPVGSSATSSARLGDERAGDADALLFAGRQLRRQRAFARGRGRACRARAHALADLAALHAAQDQRQRDVLARRCGRSADGGPGSTTPTSRRCSGTLPPRTFSRFFSPNSTAPRLGPLGELDQLEQRALAGAGMAGDEQHLARRDREADIGSARRGRRGIAC